MPILPGFFEGLSSGLLLLFFALGIAGLGFGGDWLCRGAVKLAAALKMTPLVIGLTVVSGATSMPEFFTSLFGTLTGSPGLAIGNIVGSNIANIGLILGIAAFLSPLAIRLRIIRIDVPIMIAVSLLFALLCWTSLSRLDGLILLAALIAYLVFLVRASRRDEVAQAEMKKEFSPATERKSLAATVGWVILGTVALAAGADLLVRSSVEIALRLGASEVLIGLTIVAIGTSLPELATSIAAAVRKHADMCVGNLVGSNLMNMLLVSGLVATIAPIQIERRLFLVEFPFMLFFALLLWPFFLTGRILSKKEGAVLLILYAVFIGTTAFFGWQ